MIVCCCSMLIKIFSCLLSSFHSYTKDNCGNLWSKKFSRANLFVYNIGNINLADSDQAKQHVCVKLRVMAGSEVSPWSPGRREAVRDNRTFRDVPGGDRSMAGSIWSGDPGWPSLEIRKILTGVRTHFLQYGDWWGFMWLLVGCSLWWDDSETSPLSPAIWGEIPPSSLLWLPMGRTFIGWCIRWQSPWSELCAVQIDISNCSNSSFPPFLNPDGPGTTRDPDPQSFSQSSEELIRVVGLNSCLTDKMLKRSTLGGLSSHFLEAWTSRTKDRRDPVVIIGCPAVSGSVRGSKFPGIVSLIKDRNFIIWNYWLDPPDCPVLTNWIHSHPDSLCPSDGKFPFMNSASSWLV